MVCVHYKCNMAIYTVNVDMGVLDCFSIQSPQPTIPFTPFIPEVSVIGVIGVDGRCWCWEGGVYPWCKWCKWCKTLGKVLHHLHHLHLG